MEVFRIFLGIPSLLFSETLHLIRAFNSEKNVPNAFLKKFPFCPFWPKTVKNWPFWPKMLILSHFCLFFEILCLFPQFFTLESCYIWIVTSLEYPSAYVYSCCPGKFQNRGLSGGIRGYVNPILSHFCLFSEILCLFFQFFTLESCYIWFEISLELSLIHI